MKRQLDGLLRQYGQSVTVTRRLDGTAMEGKAFVQPVLKKQADVPVAVTALGTVSGQRWLYLGSRDVPLYPGDTVESGGVKLAVQEARPVYWQDAVLYWWAMLRREKEAAV